ncbi:glycoside hydrolase family 15 [Ammoniphilus oxalaticus]|uniref:Glycoside hydrolase family 15 n=1 Tax=Ammoniphilus oxalaticus TaxID=66863 RepID=A0A419SLM5_9BACL|nr:glycoside hydrolase family 15 protein [Ammoniphilus oxalaticus]RKD24961.1 glycoside hydrolase family 15 [Ammoniphilus oxalaticus]
MLQKSYDVLEQIRLPHGLYIASPSPDYRYVWLRDCFYISLPFLDKPTTHYEQAYHRMFDLFREYEWKLDIHARQKPVNDWEYIHARYTADDIKEIHDQSWGHIQYDMIGAFLFGLAAGMKRNKKMFRDMKDVEITQKIVHYLQTAEYWQDPDHGMWEEWREVHTSSVGACVAGLHAIRPYVDVPESLIELGIEQLFGLLPRESVDKRADLAQLSLIYPYQLLDGALADHVVSQVERWLVRDRGVMRYEGDSYYSTLEAQFGRSHPLSFYYGTEAEWTFGFPWLALCHLQLGNRKQAEFYLRKTEQVMVKPGILPELYFSKTDIPNPNTPLGWSCAMYILAKEALMKLK